MSWTYAVQKITEKAPSWKRAAQCLCCQLLWISRQKYPSGKKIQALPPVHIWKNEKDKVKTESRYMSGWNHTVKSIKKKSPFTLRYRINLNRNSYNWQRRAIQAKQVSCLQKKSISKIRCIYISNYAAYWLFSSLYSIPTILLSVPKSYNQINIMITLKNLQLALYPKCPIRDTLHIREINYH